MKVFEPQTLLGGTPSQALCGTRFHVRSVLNAFADRLGGWEERWRPGVPPWGGGGTDLWGCCDSGNSILLGLKQSFKQLLRSEAVPRPDRSCRPSAQGVKNWGDFLR